MLEGCWLFPSTDVLACMMLQNETKCQKDTSCHALKMLLKWYMDAGIKLADFLGGCHVFVAIGVDHTELKAYLDRDREIG